MMRLDALKQDVEFLERAGSFGARGIYIPAEIRTLEGPFLRALSSTHVAWIGKRHKRAMITKGGQSALERPVARLKTLA